MEDLDLLGAECYLGGPAQDAIDAGNRDENALTDLEFNFRHPERIMLRDPKIQPGETALAKEWTSIRNDVVRPALAKARPKTAAPRSAPSSSAPAASFSTGPSAPDASSPAGRFPAELDKKMTRNEAFAAGLGAVALLGIGVAFFKKG